MRRVERYQHAVRLDRARNVDRLDIAGADVGLGHECPDEDFEPLCQRLKVSTAPCTAALVSIVDDWFTWSTKHVHIAPVVAPWPVKYAVPLARVDPEAVTKVPANQLTTERCPSMT